MPLSVSCLRCTPRGIACRIAWSMAQQELDNSGTTIDEVSLQVRKRKRCSGASPTPPGSDGKDSSHSTAEHAGPGCEATEQLQPTSSHHLERSWGSALRQTNSLQSGHVQSGCTGCEDADGWTGIVVVEACVFLGNIPGVGISSF